MKQEWKPNYPIANLTEHPDNPRRGDVPSIAASLDAHGFYGAVLVQKSTGRIIAGNHRTKAATQAGQTTVPALLLDVNDDEARMIMLADNKTSDDATYDDRALADLLKTILLDDNLDITHAGFTDTEALKLITAVESDPRNEVLEYSGEEGGASDEFYTPAWLFETMNIEFDLDVASPTEPLPWIPAKRRFTKADDALTQPWEGRVWMNPPYSGLATWVPKWVEHANGVCLVPLSNARWARAAWRNPDIAIAVLGDPTNDSNVKFVGGAISHPVYLLAMGDDCQEAIARCGTIRHL